MDQVVIVGASLAGVRTAEALRTGGYTGQLTLVGNEVGAPYDRPPLSKSYLEGKRTPEQLALRPADPLLAALDVSFISGVSAVGLDLERQLVHLDTGASINFDGLVIATGTSPRTIAGTQHLLRVHTLRTLQDAAALRQTLQTGANVVVIGAGFIGAEVASTAKSAGANVTVVEAAAVPLARQLGDEMGTAVAALHQRNGVNLMTGCAVSQISETHVHLNADRQLSYDACVVGVGVSPNTEWLDGNGLDLSNGVRCDSSLRVMVDGTPHERIVAVGDVAAWVNPRYAYEGPVRVEHWTNAAESADHAAATLLGSSTPFSPVPYFWSDQYGRKIQFLGRSAGFEEVVVVHGSVDDKFVALYRRDNELVGVLGVSSIKTLMQYRQKLIDRCSWADALSG